VLVCVRENADMPHSCVTSLIHMKHVFCVCDGVLLSCFGVCVQLFTLGQGKICWYIAEHTGTYIAENVGIYCCRCAKDDMCMCVCVHTFTCVCVLVCTAVHAETGLRYLRAQLMKRQGINELHIERTVDCVGATQTNAPHLTDV